MSGISKTNIFGRLGKDPEMKYLASGAALANLSIATSETWKDKQTGEKQEKTEWHRVVVFGPSAEFVGDRFQKGDQILINGKNQTRKWQDRDGNDKYTTEIVAREMKMLSPKGAGNQAQGGGYQEEEPPVSDPSPMGDDVPF